MRMLVLLLLSGLASVPAQDAENCRTRFGVSRGDSDETDDPTVYPGCMAGQLEWSYPYGSVNAEFPRELLPPGTCGKMRVCIAGSLDGDGISAQDTTGPRPTDLPITEDAEDKTWNCTLYSRSRRGVVLTLTGPDQFDHYLSVIHYRVQQLSRPNCRGAGAGGRRTRPGRRKRPCRGMGRGRARGRGRGHGRIHGEGAAPYDVNLELGPVVEGGTATDAVTLPPCERRRGHGPGRPARRRQRPGDRRQRF